MSTTLSIGTVLTLHRFGDSEGENDDLLASHAIDRVGGDVFEVGLDSKGKQLHDACVLVAWDCLSYFARSRS